MLTLALVGLLAASPATPPAPSRWVTDGAALLSPSARASLDSRLEAYQRETGHQVLVWIGTTTGGEPIESFAERAFRAWKVGRAGLDDGAVLFLFAEDRSVRIEVGYGLEPVLPDALCARLIDEQLTPLLKAGEPDAALTNTVEAMLTTIGASGGATQPASPTLTRSQWIALGVGGAGFLLLLIIRPDLALRLLALLLIFRRGGRGGGGFAGGGGRSGGGGGSGRW
jgi:uncharacterized protein